MPGISAGNGTDSKPKVFVEVDYDFDTESVQLLSASSAAAGALVCLPLSEELSSADVLLSYGVVDEEALNGLVTDYVNLEATLVNTDKMYDLKKEIVENEGFTATQRFPIFVDRFPIQLLTYLRLTRIQDPIEIAKACCYPVDTLPISASVSQSYLA
eukprot:scaffold5495_cov376-Prasinococcus_capsulatus_cf.AAC.4